MKLFLYIFFISSLVHATVNPFQTDNCTMFPEGTRQDRNLWRHCCIEHDLFFWAGGTKAERNAVDLQLKECVAQTGEVDMADLIYWGVRVGAFSPYHIPAKKWGNAWAKERPVYCELTKNETAAIIEALENQGPKLPQDLKEKFNEALLERINHLHQ